MAFNAEAFLQQSVDAANATTFEVCPEGEYLFMVDTENDTINVRELSRVSAKTGNPYSFHVLEVQCVCLDDKVRTQLGRDKVRVRASMNIDLDDAGRLETGKNKNVSLGQFKDALSQNVPGWSPMKLLGAGPFMGRVKHNTSAKNPQQKFAEIVATARVS